VTILLWVVWFVVLYYVQMKTAEFKVFDPYEILKLHRGATEKEIKKAYRQMSLKFHPDKVSSMPRALLSGMPATAGI
jgi:translocation protein SEC63